MEVFFYIILFIFWLFFGSFASVIIYRLKSWESWIFLGRSHCPKCSHILWFFDLIPLFSWIRNLARCRYCKQKISAIYPFLELTTWLLFSLIWYFLVDFNLILSWSVNEIIKLFFWIFVWFITIIYSFYDILFLEIHDWFMIFSIIFVFIFLVLQAFWIIDIFPYLINNSSFFENIVALFILIFSLILYYVIIFKELELKYDFLILFLILFFNISFLKIFNIWIFDNIFINSWIWVFIIFSFLFLQIAVSGWAWMWWWDLRIAILIGLILAYNYSIEWLFFTYIVWSIISILLVIISKFKNGLKTSFESQVPFGPFLALWFFAIIFLQKSLTEIVNLYL